MYLYFSHIFNRFIGLFRSCSVDMVLAAQARADFGKKWEKAFVGRSVTINPENEPNRYYAIKFRLIYR